MYEIKLTKIAAQNLGKFDPGTSRHILAKLESLKAEPVLMGKALEGPLKEFRSVRAAGQRYRIIYKIIDEEVIVIVIAVGVRKEGDKKDIYQLMKKYLKTGLIDHE
jgi:mRNA interferase RelE/StbE